MVLTAIAINTAAVVGHYYECSGPLAITLPTGAANGNLIGINAPSGACNAIPGGSDTITDYSTTGSTNLEIPKGQAVVLMSNGSGTWVVIEGGGVPGTSPTYVENTGNVTVSATSEATGNTLVTAGAFTANGTDAYWIEFGSSEVIAATGGVLIIDLWDGSSPIGAPAVIGPAGTSGMPVTIRRRLVPSAGSHTYSFRAFQSGGNGVVAGGPGGSGQNTPMYISIEKAAAN